MRKKLAISISLVVMVLIGVVLVDRWNLPPDPLLRAGMSESDVDELLKENGCVLAADSQPLHRIYEQGPVGFCNEKRRVTVYFDNWATSLLGSRIIPPDMDGKAKKGRRVVVRLYLFSE
jgi:hypothetical protein